MNLDERIDATPGSEIILSEYDGTSFVAEHLKDNRESIKQLIRDVLEHVKPEHLVDSKVKGYYEGNIMHEAWKYNQAVKDMEAKIKELGL